MTWLKVDAACAYAGGLDRKTLYAAVRAGDLMVARVGTGRNILFADCWIDDWLSKGADHRHRFIDRRPERVA